ncbi:MAG: DUF3119 family protein [Pseudanabaenaceae cyanobacterium]
MTTSTSSPSTLTPSFAIPITLILGAIPIFALQTYVALVLVIFGLFLLVQTATIRLHFTETALDIYRSGNLIRHFPYSEWRSWRIFWGIFPVLFYFREVNSIHFLPILFNSRELKSALMKHLAHLG